MLENKHSTSTKQRMTVSTFAKKTSAFLVHSSCPLKKPSLVAAFRIVKHLMFTIASWGFKGCSKLNVDGFLDVIRRTSLHFYLDGSILSQHEHQAYKWVQIIWWYVFNIHNLVMLHVSPHLGSVGSQTWSFPCWHPCATQKETSGVCPSEPRNDRSWAVPATRNGYQTTIQPWIRHGFIKFWSIKCTEKAGNRRKSAVCLEQHLLASISTSSCFRRNCPDAEGWVWGKESPSRDLHRKLWIHKIDFFDIVDIIKDIRPSESNKLEPTFYFILILHRFL